MRKSASPPLIVADASPLIGLAKVNRLGLLRQLFQGLLIPEAVERELCLDSPRPGARVLAVAKSEGWLTSVSVENVPAHLLATVDPGEAEAITLARRRSALLLIDEWRGRVAATSEGVRIFGTGAVLLRAKERGFLPTVAETLGELTSVGYRLSGALQAEILRRAGESG